MTIDSQIAWDRETAADVRLRLRARAAAIRRCQEDLAQRRDDYRRQRRLVRQLHEEMTERIETEGDDDIAAVRQIEQLTRVAEEARLVEEQERQEVHLARVRLHKAQDELRAAVRRSMAPAPLFDRPAGGRTAIPTMEEILAAESDADAEEQGLEPDTCAAQAREPSLPDGHPWPEWLTDELLRDAMVHHKLQQGKAPTKPIAVQAIRWDDHLWIANGACWGTDYDTTTLLPLIPAAEFQERWPDYPLRLTPGLPDTDEDRLQYYTGLRVRLRAGRKEYVIAPAGEGRTLVRAVAKDESNG